MSHHRLVPMDIEPDRASPRHATGRPAQVRLAAQAEPQELRRLAAEVVHLVSDHDGLVIVCDVLTAPGRPEGELHALGVLLRLQLVARRRGSRLELGTISDRMRELVDLAGLAEQLPHSTVRCS